MINTLFIIMGFQDTGFLLKRLSILKDLQTCGETISKPDVVEEPLITGMETFSVNYKVNINTPFDSFIKSINCNVLSVI